MVISLLHPRKFAIRTWFCNCPQYFCLFHIVFECSPSIHDPGKMLVLPNRLLCWVLYTSDQDFVSFQPILWHPHTQIRKTLFTMNEETFPIWKHSPNRTSIGSSQIAFPIIVLLKGWPYRWRSRGTTGSSILDHDLGHLCRGRRIQMSGHSDFGFFNNLWASSIFTWVLRWYCVCCLSIAARQSGADIHDLGGCHLRCWRSLFSDILRKTLRSSFAISPRRTTRPLYFWCFASKSAFFRWHMSINDAKWTVLRPSSLLHRSPFSYFWLSSSSTPKISPIFPIPCPPLPSLQEFSQLET